jgi:hypothetical protein
MNRKYAQSLKFSELENDIKFGHFNTDEDFYDFQNNYNAFETSKKNYKITVKRHLSEYEEIIPPENFQNEYRTEYNNTIFLEKKDLSSAKKYFGYSSNNIHFDDVNYQKYIVNLRNEDSYNNRTKRTNKKNYSQNKNIITPDTYNIIQIYEAPPLELTPIMEIEKSEEKRKPPKYFRKRIIYSLEEENEKNNENNNINNENRNNYYKFKNSNIIKKNKLRNYNSIEEISNDYSEKIKEEKNDKIYLKYSTKENKKNLENKKTDEINKNYKRKDYSKYIKYEKDNINKSKESNNSLNNFDKKEKILFNNKKGQGEEKDNETKKRENDVNKKIKKKNYVSKRNMIYNIKIEENKKIQDDKKEESKNELIKEKNKIDYNKNYREKFKNNIVINDNLKKKSGKEKYCC